MNAHMHANRSDASATNFMPGRSLLLQRQCACGGSVGTSGECATCANKRRLQAKLSIGASNDPMEQEADRVADQVLAAPVHPAVNTAPNIQRYTGQTSSVAGTAPASVDQVLASGGRPLESGLQQDMGQRFGHDFSRVRVHTGTVAEQSARDVNADAYTVEHNIVFGTEKFAPETQSGRRLLAHELTHVVQQCAPAGSIAGAVSRVPPRIHRQPAQTRFLQDQLVITTIPVNWLSDLAGEPGSRPVPPLRKGALLKLGASHPKGNGQVFYATLMKSRTEADSALVGVVRTNWIRPDASASVPSTTSLGAIYEEKLKEGVDRLAAKTGFQRCDLELPDVATKPLFDSEYWEKVNNADPEQTMLRLKKGPAHEAIDQMFDHPERWTFDCAQFVQVIQLYAQRHALGNDAFDKKVGIMTIRPHFSRGVETEQLYNVEGAITKSGIPLKTLSQELLDEVPLGSRVMWRNLSATGTMRNENAIKVGKDSFAAKGFEPDVYFTQSQIKEKLSKLTVPPGEVILAEIEVYKRPTKP